MSRLAQTQFTQLYQTTIGLSGEDMTKPIHPVLAQLFYVVSEAAHVAISIQYDGTITPGYLANTTKSCCEQWIKDAYKAFQMSAIKQPKLIPALIALAYQQNKFTALWEDSKPKACEASRKQNGFLGNPHASFTLLACVVRNTPPKNLWINQTGNTQDGMSVVLKAMYLAHKQQVQKAKKAYTALIATQRKKFLGQRTRARSSASGDLSTMTNTSSQLSRTSYVS